MRVFLFRRRGWDGRAGCDRGGMGMIVLVIFRLVVGVM